MTLAAGNRVVKLDQKGEPIAEGESHVEFEVVGSPVYNSDDGTQTVRLKVIR